MGGDRLHIVSGAGQVGSALAAHLAGLGMAVRAAVSRHRPPALAAVDWRAADAADPATELPEAFAGLGADGKSTPQGGPGDPLQLGATFWHFRHESRVTSPPSGPVENVASGPGTRTRRVLLSVAGVAVSCGVGALLVMVQASQADAAGTVSCTTSGSVLDVAVSGTGSDSLVVTTSGGSYQISFDGASACALYSDSEYTTVQVTDSGAAVPVVFQPGTDDGVTFEGPGTSATLDLSAAPSGAVVSVQDGTLSYPSAPGNVQFQDKFGGILAFTGSSAGSTDFAAGPGGGYTFTGQGSGNTLDLSAAPSGVDVSVPAGTVSGLTSGGNDTFTGFSAFTGSSAGSTDFAAGPGGGYAFTGQGTGNALDLSAAPSGVDVSLPAGPVILPGGASDAFSGITAFTGSSAGSTDFVATGTGTLVSLTGQGTSNTLDLAALSASAGTPLVVNAEPSSGPGAVSSGSSQLVTFTGIQNLTGATSGATEFVTGSVGGLDFTGKGAGNTLSFGDVTMAAGVQVSLNPDAQGQETADPGSGTDTFTGLGTIIGSSGNDTFSGGPGNYTIQDSGANNTFSDASAPNGITVSFSAGTATVTGGYPGMTTTTDITTFAGSAAGGNTFQASAAGGYTFEGNGSDNTLDLSAAPNGVTVTLNGDSPSSPGVVANLNSGPGGSTSDRFWDIQVVTGAPSTMSLASSADPSVFGRQVTFTATVALSDGGGTVAFFADGSATPISGCGTQSLTQVSGLTYSATCTTSSLPAGTHSISATYTGDSNSAGNTASLPGGQTVNLAAQSISFTAPGTGTVSGSATLTATGGASGNPVVFTVDPSSGTGVCTVSGANGSTVNYAGAGSCVIDANQAGNATYTAAPQVTQTITVNQAPAFVIDSPPLTAAAGHPYDYIFQASGTPAPTYALASGAPSWLAVNASTGEVTGAPPSGTASFSYAVTATNVAGHATSGPFTVTVTKPSPNADVSAVLSCPASLTVGGTGTCTLAVANAGPATASKVIAAVTLPPALSETSCSPGCARHANLYTWTLSSLADGASAKLSIAVKASRTGTATVLAAAVSQNIDPDLRNNISTQQITIKR
jgi:Domain of unknown function DUF11/Bacterial Ig-like domain (group 3)/Putative Ig domain